MQIKRSFYQLILLGVCLGSWMPTYSMVEWLAKLPVIGRLAGGGAEPAMPEYAALYAINLMWINRELPERHAYIYPVSASVDAAAAAGGATLDHCTATLQRWAALNPTSQVHLWFDSELTPAAAVENTRLLLERSASSAAGKRAKIALRDIRDLTVVKSQPAVFSSQTPVYFRADLLRPIIMQAELQAQPEQCVIYTDFDVKPMNKTELFDRPTVAALREQHFVLARETNSLGFENSFQMFTHDPALLQALDVMLVEANLARAKTYLTELAERDKSALFSNPAIWRRHTCGFQENVYYSYPLMHAYAAQLRGGEPLLLPGATQAYDHKRDAAELGQIAKVIMFRSSAYTSYLKKQPLPTKAVVTPDTSSFMRELKRPARD